MRLSITKIKRALEFSRQQIAEAEAELQSAPPVSQARIQERRREWIQRASRLERSLPVGA